MRILITGATGFLGSHLTRTLLSYGNEVHAFRRGNVVNSRLSNVADTIKWYEANSDVNSVLKTVRPEVVLHAATVYGRMGESIANIERVNFEWPSALISAAAANESRLFVNIDTSLPPGLGHYSRTKRAFAEVAKTKAESLDRIRVLNLKLESVFGAGDDPSKFQMMLLHALLRGDPVFPMTLGDQTRDYIYVVDAVAAILLLIDHAYTADNFFLSAGVGSGRSVRIRDFAETINRQVGGPTRLEFGMLPYREGELMEACANVSELALLGWQGARSLDEGVRLMIEKERRTV
jgi:CDP-paratose synthetase